jgi:hypothetical protein
MMRSGSYQSDSTVIPYEAFNLLSKATCNYLFYEGRFSIEQIMYKHRYFGRVCVPPSLVFCVMFCRSLFVLFRSAIVLPVVLIFTASD